MKMPDGGFRPAYNVELATDQAKGIIVGVRVVMEGTDAGQAPPMEEQVKERTGQHPGAYLMDGGFATREDITALEERDVTVYAPVKLPRANRRKSGTGPATAIPPKWNGGVSVWPRRKPRLCTGNEAPPPNGPMPK